MLRRLWHSNWTPSWGWLKVAVGSAALGIQQLGQVITNSDVKEAIANLHIDPKIALGLAILGAITVVSAAR